MARGANRDRGKERYWRRVLRHWRRNGQGVRSYCREHGLSEPSFYAWRRIIQQRDREAAGHRLQPGRRPARESRASAAVGRGRGAGLPAFVPLTLAPLPACLEVVLGDGRVVRVPVGFDAEALRQLLAVLHEAPPC